MPSIHFIIRNAINYYFLEIFKYISKLRYDPNIYKMLIIHKYRFEEKYIYIISKDFTVLYWLKNNIVRYI